MNSTTLKALRTALHFTVEEAAKLIGAHSARMWRYMEAGERPIPEKIAREVRNLCKTRHALATSHAGYEPVELWYETLEDWLTVPGASIAGWKPYCSAIADKCCNSDAVLVKFDWHDYLRWLNGHTDTPARRIAWAHGRV